MAQELDLELKKLIVGTNDQRRRVGQTLYHFYRTLIFWQEKGWSFHDVARAWSAGGAMVFDSLAMTLAEMGDAQVDERLRRFVMVFLRHLAADLRRGDHMFVPFLRWLQERFPEITKMMMAESSTSRIYDVELAELLSQVFSLCARSDRDGMIAALEAAAGEL